MFFAWWMLDEMTLLLEYFWQIFVFQMYISFKSKFSILLFYITEIFIHFCNVFALDSLKIASVLNSRLPGPRWWTRFHIVLEYNIENMRFIRLLLANQIAYILALMISNSYCTVQSTIWNIYSELRFFVEIFSESFFFLKIFCRFFQRLIRELIRIKNEERWLKRSSQFQFVIKTHTSLKYI